MKKFDIAALEKAKNPDNFKCFGQKED